jgi:hypothetical protein
MELPSNTAPEMTMLLLSASLLTPVELMSSLTSRKSNAYHKGLKVTKEAQGKVRSFQFAAVNGASIGLPILGLSW